MRVFLRGFIAIMAFMLFCAVPPLGAKASEFASLSWSVDAPTNIGQTTGNLVRFQGQDNNPKAGLYYKLQSDSDVVRLDQSHYRSDKHGEMRFNLTRVQKGSFCIQVREPVQNTQITQKCYAYNESTQNTRNIGDYLLGSSFDTPSGSSGNTQDPEGTMTPSQIASLQLSGFEVQDVPQNIYQNEAFDMTVKAVDDNGNVLKDYRGTIEFISSDNAAVLPNDYTFTREDEGEHTFALGIIMKNKGNHYVQVQDMQKITAKERMNIQVQSRSRSDNTSQNVAQKPEIVYPSSGAKFAKRSIQIRGENALPSSSVLVYDGLSKVAEVSSNSDGSFNVELQDLQSGTHEISALYFDENDVPSEVSDTVSFTIDPSLPTFRDFKMQKRDVPEGEAPNISFDTTGNVEQAFLYIDDKEYTMTSKKQDKSRYQMLDAIYLEPWQYKLRTKLINQQKQEIEYELPSSLQVLNWDDTDNNDTPPVQNGTQTGANQNTDTSQEDDNLVHKPSAVTAVKVVASDNRKRVHLTWSEATDDERIAFYRIYYGTRSDMLPYIEQTKDARTAWYIDGMKPGTHYYFKVLAVDSRGNEGRVLASSKADVVTPDPQQWQNQNVQSTHIVKPGETIISIASEYNVSRFTLADTNNIDVYAQLTAGQKLTVPKQGEGTIDNNKLDTTVQSGPMDTLLLVFFILVLADLSVRIYGLVRR